MSSTPFDDIQRQRHQGWRGGDIPLHRGLRVLQVTSGLAWRPAALGGLLCALTIGAVPLLILPLWFQIESLWCAGMTGGECVMESTYPLFGPYALALPLPALGAPPPSSLQWWWGALLVLAGVLLAWLMPRCWLPLRLFAASGALALAIALLSFTPVLGPFPYDLDGYLESLLIAGLILVCLVPLLYALIYYPLDFSLGRQLLLTWLTQLWLVIFIPMQYLLHAWLIRHLSLLAMAPLFLFAGLMLDIAGIVGLYTWAMSWRTRHVS